MLDMVAKYYKTGSAIVFTRSIAGLWAMKCPWSTWSPSRVFWHSLLQKEHEPGESDRLPGMLVAGRVVPSWIRELTIFLAYDAPQGTAVLCVKPDEV